MFAVTDLIFFGGIVCLDDRIRQAGELRAALIASRRLMLCFR
jgi:hypothetical protein